MVLIVNGKDIGSNRFPHPPWHLYDVVLSMGFVAWKSRHVEKFFTVSSMSAFMLMDSHASSLVFLMLM